MNYLDNLKKRVHDGADKMSYRGRKVAQRYGVHEALDEFHLQLKEDGYSPARIIEIGTNFGGFSLLLRDHPISNDAEIITYDIDDKGATKYFVGTDISFIQENVFSVEDELGSIISNQGQTIIFCDGGNKAKEFQTFAKYLKKGDIILGHDYAVDVDDYMNRVRGKIWNWLELQESDIRNTCVKEGLQPYCEEIFKQYIWACRIKN